MTSNQEEVSDSIGNVNSEQIHSYRYLGVIVNNGGGTTTMNGTHE